MSLYPEAQQKAQEELDLVIGRERLPDLSDKGRLPYLEAVYKETLRLVPNAPLGFPHAVSKDDVYNGMRIPEGAMVLPNQW